MNICTKRIAQKSAYALKRTNCLTFPNYNRPFFVEDANSIMDNFNLSAYNDIQVYLNVCNKTKKLKPISKIWLKEIKNKPWAANVKITRKYNCDKDPYGVIFNLYGYYSYNRLNEFKNAMDKIY